MVTGRPLMSEALCYQDCQYVGFGLTPRSMALKVKARHRGFTCRCQRPSPRRRSVQVTDGCVWRALLRRRHGILYDWAYDELSPAQRTQIYTTANAWQTSWETPGGCSAFAYEHPPLGNYFADGLRGGKPSWRWRLLATIREVRLPEDPIPDDSVQYGGIERRGISVRSSFMPHL